MISKITKENKRIPKPKQTLVCLLLFLVIIILGLPMSTAVAYFSVFNHKIFPQVSICAIPVSGKTKKETLLVIEKLISQSPDSLILTTENKNYPLTFSSLSYNPQISVDTLYSLGRNKNQLENLKQIFFLYTNGFNENLKYVLDEEKLNNEIATIAAELFQAPVNPEIKVVNNNQSKKIVIEEGKDGKEIDVPLLKSKISDFLACPTKESTLTIPLTIKSFNVPKEIVDLTEKRALALLDKKIVLQLDDQMWEINDEELISFLSFTDGYFQNKINDYIEDFSQTINVLPENATFQFENGIVKLFKPSKDGITLNKSEFPKRLVDKIIELETSGQNQKMEIPVERTPANISTGNANSLGIKELVGRGTSLFYGSIAGRIHNLQLASLKLNGILIAPEETFSFNRALGDVSAQTGFKQAYIIKNGKTVLGDGGGVCQVSTTLFRAALNSGLPIIERRAHAYRVHYYEDDLGPGFDATVFDPTADLKIKNNTSNNILIQTAVDLKTKQVTFDLYGTKDGRQVEISKARVWDKQPPPPDLYQDDPTLPTGTINQIDWKAWGAKAAFDYKVTRDGETLFEKTFTSVYKPWQAVYLRGTGM